MAGTDHRLCTPRIDEIFLRSLLFSAPLSQFPRLLGGALSGALTGMFAVVGAFAGAVAGAIAGQVTENGLLRGAVLGAVAGAILSIEVLDAAKAYWCSEPRHAVPSPSITELMDNLLNGRFVQDQLAATTATRVTAMENFEMMSYEDLYEIFGVTEQSRPQGVSLECIEKLPCHTFTQGRCLVACGESVCCSICLQELLKGEIVRCLPTCHHMFHMCCVDKWLLRHNSCPMCRRDVENHNQPNFVMSS